MSYFDRPLLLMFLGSPGSGKSYFARAFADKTNAVRINGDLMRTAIFGSRAETNRIYNSKDRNILNDYVFHGLDYVADQILLRGHDVVYDAHTNKRIDRESHEKLARSHGAVPIVVWIKTPFEVALRRGQEREETIDQKRMTEDEMREVIARHERHTDAPDEAENVLIISGEVPFDEQFTQFSDQLATIMSKEIKNV